MIGKTLETSLHILALVLFAAGTLTAYVWFFPLGVVLEIGSWVYYGFYYGTSE